LLFVNDPEEGNISESDSHFGYNAYYLADYNNDTVPEYWAATGPNWFADPDFFPWCFTLYTLHRTYPRRATPLPHGPAQLYVLPYLTFGPQYTITHGDSVVAVW